MKTENEIRKQLELVYQHRFLLRCERKMKKCCKNCQFSNETSFNLGEFGVQSKFVCTLKDGNQECKFKPKFSAEDIEKEMIEDISNPSVCGAKEPKIAALLWVLHENRENQESIDTMERKPSLIQKIFGVFKNE